MDSTSADRYDHDGRTVADNLDRIASALERIASDLEQREARRRAAADDPFHGLVPKRKL